MKKAIVITPTTGSSELTDCIRSVRRQTFPNTHHLLVVDGVKYTQPVDRVLKDVGIVGTGDSFFRCDLPFNTGGGGYYGHRVMAAFGHLIPDYDYVLFLDQDNWYDPDHVESLVDVCESKNMDWSYSLRKIYNADGTFVTEDNCESLGKWPVWTDPTSFLIDTSSFCFKVPYFKLVGYLWDFGWGADRRFYHILKDVMHHIKNDCSFKYSLNYRLGGNEGSVKAEFFEAGNKNYQVKYNGALPWKKTFL